jgi:hypothetical protein
VALRTMSGRTSAESVEDVTAWLQQLTGCPPINQTVVALCRASAHGDEPGMWWLVEADAKEGVARVRCLACGATRPVLASEERWTYPMAWSCPDCRQSIAEVVFGVHAEEGVATWMAMAVRCVNCGDISGVADFVVPAVPTADLTATL